MADVWAGRMPAGWPVMEISIRLDTVAPPAGTVLLVAAGTASAGGRPEPAVVDFVGWLGLLRALSELIGEPSAAPSSGATPVGDT